MLRKGCSLCCLVNKNRGDGNDYANDLVRAAFAAVHNDVKLTVLPYARCKADAMQAAVAACFNMSPALEKSMQKTGNNIGTSA
jgi:hypothetical protein